MNLISTVIIPAAGKGKRMNAQVSKQYLSLANKPILIHTIEAFQNCDAIDHIIVVVGKGEVEYCRSLFNTYDNKKVLHIIEGGSTRQDSVFEGIKKLSDDTNIVLIHDGARPFINKELIEKVIISATKNQACILGVKAKDTIKIVDEELNITHTPDREALWMVQTPQVFKKEIIDTAYRKAMDDGYIGTDDAMLVEKYCNLKIKMVEGSYNNIKITTHEDLIIGEMILKNTHCLI